MQHSKGSSLVSLTREDLIILNNALNEILHGSHFEEFEARIGFARDEVEKRLEAISASWAQLLNSDRVSTFVRDLVFPHPHSASAYSNGLVSRLFQK